MSYALVFVGGGLGAVARFGIGRWAVDAGWAVDVGQERALLELDDEVAEQRAG